MNIRLAVKKIAKVFGIDLRAYHPSRSEAARLGSFFKYYGVDLILDVGANSGQFTEYLRYVGYSGRIVCFEPLLAPYTRLHRLSKKKPDIICAPRMALGDYDGEITVNCAANPECSSVLNVTEWQAEREPQMKFVGSEKVQIHRLDTVVQDYLRDADKPFLKIDVQGYEYQVLNGATELLPKLVGLQLELSLVPLYEGGLSYRDMISQVERAGFLLYDLNPCYSDAATGRTMQVDALFCRG